ncbi:MAG: hypothetical protein P9M15_00505 [Candidatus Electryoneaceae bacterium]|nr:hypothetical protein [Candidatus Electryoneaceae bacterium]
MKVLWDNNQQNGDTPDKSPPDTSFDIEKLSVGHNRAEMYLRLGEAVIILPPAVAKRLADDLRQTIDHWEAQNGTIAEPRRPHPKKSLARQVVKALYKTRKVSNKLISINTRRRKHPRRED